MKKTFIIFGLFLVIQLFHSCEKIYMPSWAHFDGVYLLDYARCFNKKIIEYEEKYSKDSFSKYNITGKWKLLVDVSTGEAIDYSCKSITYSFDENGKVEIQSNVKEITSGNFRYEYVEDPYCPTCLGLDIGPNLIIGDSMYFCQVTISLLTVNSVKYYEYYEENSDTVIFKRRGDVVKVFYRNNLF